MGADDELTGFAEDVMGEGDLDSEGGDLGDLDEEM
jgi:hypothetical protein